MYSWRLVEVHFWLAISGTVIYVFAMWNSGITQGLMWRTYKSDTLRYSFSSTSSSRWHPARIARAFGGLLFLIGACVGLYNVLMTIRRVPYGAATLDYPTESEASEPAVPAAE